MNVRSRSEKYFEACAHIVLTVLCLLAIIPFLLLIIASFTDEAVAIAQGYKFFPEKFSMMAYKYIFKEWAQIGQAYVVTIIVTVVGTFGSVIFTTMYAYGLTIKNIPGLKIVFFLTLFTMLFNGGIVSTYYIYCNLMNIRNTLGALIIPSLMMNGFNVILVKNYISTNIPGELIEAAEIDGAGSFRIYYKLILPLSTPIMATVGLMSAVGYWNDWNNGLYYITDNRLYSIQQLLNQMNSNIQYLMNNASKLTGMDMASLPSATIRMAIAVVAIIPILCVYPFFQKYFAKGITLGAVKG